MSDEARAGIIWIFVMVIAVFAPLFANERLSVDPIFEYLHDGWGVISANPFLFNFLFTFLSLASLFLFKKTGQGIKKGVKWAFAPKPSPPLGELCQIILKELEGECTTVRETQILYTANYRFSCVYHIYHMQAPNTAITDLFEEHEKTALRKAQDASWERTTREQAERERQALLAKHKSKPSLLSGHIASETMHDYQLSGNLVACMEANCPVCGGKK